MLPNDLPGRMGGETYWERRSMIRENDGGNPNMVVGGVA